MLRWQPDDTAALIGLRRALASACACAGGRQQRPPPCERFVEVTPAQERADGRAARRARCASSLPLIDDPLVLGYVNDIGQSLVRQLEPQPFVYRFRVVVDSTLNAFAGPAGYVYFHTGLILAAGSLDELAGVMAHEIAHAKRSHVRALDRAGHDPRPAREGRSASAWRSAADEPGALIAAEGVSQSLQLAYSREFEAEADEVGVAFLVRAGYDPMGMATLLRAPGRGGAPAGARLRGAALSLEPSRVEVAPRRRRGARAQHHGAGPRRPAPARGLPRARRCASTRVLDSGRTTLSAGHPAPDPTSERRGARAGRAAGARPASSRTPSRPLVAGEREEPNDPRLPFRRGEWLRELGRRPEAIAAWQRALVLDPEVALTYFQIGRAYKELGDRDDAVFYLEQAERRFEPGKTGQLRAERMVRVLTLPVFAAAGFADGERSAGADTPGGPLARRVRGRHPHGELVGARRARVAPSDAPRWS